MSQPGLAVRVNHANPNHHLWDNHGTWWMHYTLHLPDFTKRRVRQSLATRCVDTARRRRDVLINRLQGKAGCVTNSLISEVGVTDLIL